MGFLPYIVGAVAAGIGGGLLAAWWTPGRWVTSYIQHFAAGVVIAVVALQLTPDLERLGAPAPLVLGGFALGGLVMTGIKWWTLRVEQRERHLRRAPWGLAIAAAIDTALDGTIIGAGFVMAEETGLLLSLGLGLELLFLTLSVGSAFREDQASRWTTIAVSTGISLLLLIGAVCGLLLLQGAAPSTLAMILSFGAAALLYLVTEELLIETHLPQETLLSTAMFFLGFLAIFAFVAFGEGS